jgi:hypothetical protein
VSSETKVPELTLGALLKQIPIWQVWAAAAAIFAFVSASYTFGVFTATQTSTVDTTRKVAEIQESFLKMVRENSAISDKLSRLEKEKEELKSLYVQSRSKNEFLDRFLSYELSKSQPTQDSEIARVVFVRHIVDLWQKRNLDVSGLEPEVRKPIAPEMLKQIRFKDGFIYHVPHEIALEVHRSVRGGEDPPIRSSNRVNN